MGSAQLRKWVWPSFAEGRNILAASLLRPTAVTGKSFHSGLSAYQVVAHFSEFHMLSLDNRNNKAVCDTN